MDRNTTAQTAASAIPNNAQLQQTIQNTRVALDDARNDASLNQRGQLLVEDAKQLMDASSRMISEKNSDERMQRMIGNGIFAARDTRTGVTGTNMPVGREDLLGMKGEAQQAYYASKDLVMMCIRSRQFRDIIMELIELVQTMLKSTQEKLGQNSSLNSTQVAQQMANETVIPEEQKQQLYDRFRTLLVQLSSRPEYSAAVDHIFTVFDHLQSTTGQLRTTATEVAQTSSVPTGRYQDMLQDAILIMEQFSGVGTVDEFIRRVQNLMAALRQDEQAKSYMTEVRQYIKEVLRTPAILDDQTRTNYGRNLVERGRVLVNGKYRAYFSDCNDALRTIFVNVRNDSVTQDFSTKLQKFVSDFAFDEQGRPDLFVLQQSFSQMKSFMVPMISRALSNLPVPRIQGSNDKYDFAIDQLVLNVGDLLPDFIDIRTKTDNRMNVQHLSADKRSTKIVMEVERIRAHFRNIHFWYRRKHMPRLEDEGVADVDLSAGTGVTIKLVWKLSSVNGQPYQLRLSRVLCNISKLRITIRNARHSVLDKLVTKLFAGMIKKQIATAIVNNIQKFVEPLGARLNTLFKTKPAHGLANRVNTQMKNTLFTGNSDQRSMFTRARGTIGQGVQQMKQRRQNRAPRPQFSGYNARNYGFEQTRSSDLNGNGIPDYLESGRGYNLNNNFYHTPEWERDFQWYHPSQLGQFGAPTQYTRGSSGADWNGNGIPDYLESGRGYSRSGDWNGNGIPDSMERRGGMSDLNRNGIPDSLERRGGMSDLNRNGIPDSMERTSGYGGYDRTDDWNGNGIPDSMERRYRGDDDWNGNGIPDSMERRRGGWAGDFGHLDDDDLAEDFDDIELGDYHNDNRWNNNKWNGTSRSRDYGYDDSREDLVGHDWTRGSANRYGAI